MCFCFVHNRITPGLLAPSGFDGRMFREQMQEDRLVAVPGLRLVKVIEAVTTNGDGSGGGAANRRKKRDIGGGGETHTDNDKRQAIFLLQRISPRDRIPAGLFVKRQGDQR